MLLPALETGDYDVPEQVLEVQTWLETFLKHSRN